MQWLVAAKVTNAVCWERVVGVKWNMEHMHLHIFYTLSAHPPTPKKTHCGWG